MSKRIKFGAKRINFLILTKFCLHPISKVLISDLTFVFENFELKFPDLSILGKKKLLSNYNEILPVPYFEGVAFKSDILSLQFLATSTQAGRANSMSPFCNLFGKRF